MSSSLSSLADNLAEGFHNDKFTDCKSYLEIVSVKDNQLKFNSPFGFELGHGDIFSANLHGSTLQIWVLILELLKWEDLGLVYKSMYRQLYLYCTCSNCLMQLSNGDNEDCSRYMMQHGIK